MFSETSFVENTIELEYPCNEEKYQIKNFFFKEEQGMMIIETSIDFFYFFTLQQLSFLS